jgi:hypothetical protein
MRLQALFTLFVLLFGSAAYALPAGPRFECKVYGGQQYIEVIDSHSKKYDIYFVTSEQCKAEAVKLEDAQTNRAHLPLEVCGCQRGSLPSFAPGMGRTSATLYCYTVNEDGKISWANKFYSSSLGGAALNDCEAARVNPEAAAAAATPSEPKNKF